jgi:prophage antirepressor-like protein
MIAVEQIEFTPRRIGNIQARTLQHDGAIWWVAKDVCGALGLTNTAAAMVGLGDEDRSVVFTGRTESTGGSRLSIVSMAGLCALIFGARKPESMQLKQWAASHFAASVMADIHCDDTISGTLPDPVDQECDDGDRPATSIPAAAECVAHADCG